jgi:hypothetical protein
MSGSTGQRTSGGGMTGTQLVHRAHTQRKDQGMPRIYAYAGAVPWVDFEPRLTLASLYEDTTLGYWTSVNGRIGVLAKAVIDLNDQTTAETNRRFDRIETLLEERFAEVKTDLAGVKADVAELKVTVNRIDARVEQQAGWIASDEAKGKRARR